MTIKKFNSIEGYSVGENPIDVVDSTGNVTANNLTVNQVASFSGISGVKIPGGDPGDVISTDGSGNLSFISVAAYSGYSGFSGYSGYSGESGYSGYSGISGYSGESGYSGYSGYSGLSGFSGVSPVISMDPIAAALVFGSPGGEGETPLTIINDTGTNTSYYVGMSSASTGDWTVGYVSDTKLYFNPSTGTLNATLFNTLSDINAKTNITQITNALDIVDLLNGVEFNFKENNVKSAGVIAQQLKNVLPHLVGEDNTVNYLGIIAYLIEAIKELHTLQKGNLLK